MAADSYRLWSYTDGSDKFERELGPEFKVPARKMRVGVADGVPIERTDRGVAVTSFGRGSV